MPSAISACPSRRATRRNSDCSPQRRNEVVKRSYEGGCHCGCVRFRVTADLSRVTECNCSICGKKGFLHLIVALAGGGYLPEWKYRVPLVIENISLLNAQPRVRVIRPALERHADYEEGPIPHV